MPRKVFTAGEVLAAADVNTYLMDQAVMTFAGTAARGSAIGTATEGMVTYLADSNTFEFWNGSAFVGLSAAPVAVDYLVIAGGGGGSLFSSGAGAGGGGAGGYRNNVSGELSGGSAVAEAALSVPKGTFPLTVGAGGAGATTASASGGRGNFSQFYVINCVGGGAGGIPNGNSLGGSGGGGFRDRPTAYPGITGQGFEGGTGNASFTGACGGGGAGAKGVNATGNGGTNGGAGLASSITGSSVTRAGGGGGSGDGAAGGTGGTGGGGDGGVNDTSATNATVNTGSGGGGAERTPAVGGNGGSGIIVFRVPTGTTISFSGGVTQTNSTVGSKQVYVVTATSTTSETVTFG
jgi:hypothetical protein